MAGLTGNIGLISSGIQYAVFIIGTAATFFFIDTTGRRPLLIYGAVAMGICMFVVGGVLGSYGTTLPNGLDGNLSVKVQVTGAPANTVIAFCYLLILAYSLTLAPIAWVYTAEVWSLETRATGVALATVANWLFNFAIGLFIPPAFQNISCKLFIIFGILCMAAAVQAFFTYPETAGKTIEEIELLFSKGAIAPWKTKPGDSLLDAKIAEVRRFPSPNKSSATAFIVASRCVCFTPNDFCVCRARFLLEPCLIPKRPPQIHVLLMDES